MAVTFDLGNGTTCSPINNTQLMDTQRGLVPADEVVQGDFIRNVAGDPRLEVLAAPVVT